MLDIARLREDTPGCENVIHFNNAGAALMPKPVLDTVIAHLQREAAIGGYEAASEAREQLEGVYRSIARLLNSDPDEIAVVENATRAWDMAFYSLPLKAGDVVLTASTEYASNYIPYLQLKRRRGIEIRVIPNDEHSQVSVSALREMLNDKRVKLISLPHIATNGGPVQPVEAIGAAAREAGIWFLLDACQSVGHLPIDVKKVGCHMLSSTSRKYLRGPRGMGFLYIECDLAQSLEPILLDLHAAMLSSSDDFTILPNARRFENWEANFAAKLGMGAAVEYALELGLDSIWARIQTISLYLRECLGSIPGVTVTDQGALKSGIVTFTVKGIAAEVVRDALLAEKINVTSSSFRATILDMQERGLPAVVRTSVHAYNTEEEVERVAEKVASLGIS
ncbi:MAG: aminotransferase class V-fold PLP-dependent enzyme [Candidatus Tectomicrobia bacterium]|nr:aminotransferase class V-fold PLP-dependent enzyme [Candidatus Tectomicrobia bacterium]